MHSLVVKLHKKPNRFQGWEILMLAGRNFSLASVWCAPAIRLRLLLGRICQAHVGLCNELARKAQLQLRLGRPLWKRVFRARENSRSLL